ncbi:hypothetical protein [Succinivibrio dextrinosolvens]|uniref:hypothetical protein n=1 Tax=Succinivibrio dextrinosolvens TaxID=83771 RepID=UPI00241D755A|nr:hypothetical protein [Succinivibrio dextrinosolvens]MBE6422845.1 hypothetical protein [Succinivibrio dextrinosolvens]
MDGIKFINSKHIQHHLREIDYRLSSEQILFLLLNNHFMTVDERIAALRELKETAPNDKLVSITNKFFEELVGIRLHDFIDSYLKNLNRHIAFLKEEDKRFCYQLYGLSDSCKYKLIGSFQNYENSHNRIEEESDCYNYFKLKKIPFEDAFDREYFRQKYMELPYAEAYIDKSLVLMDCFANDTNSKPQDHYTDSMYITIPLPFRKGDIVRFRASPWIEMTDKEKKSEYSVFHSYAPTEDSLHKYQGTDRSDMYYCGYRPKKHGFKLNYYDFFCFDIEYADSAEIKGHNKRLKALSAVLKEK